METELKSLEEKVFLLLLFPAQAYLKYLAEDEVSDFLLDKAVSHLQKDHYRHLTKCFLSLL